MGKHFYSLILAVILQLSGFLVVSVADAQSQSDTTNLVYPFEDQKEHSLPRVEDKSPLKLYSPDNIKYEWKYDSETDQFILYQKIGDFYYRAPKVLDKREYLDYDFKQTMRQYWNSRAMAREDGEYTSGLIPSININNEIFEKVFGSSVINIKPQGYVEVSLGYQINRRDDPQIEERLRRVGLFDFDQNINLSVTGSIGDKINLNMNFNTEASFDFENRMNIKFEGDEDQIVQNVEAGNVSMPLSGSLIQGGSNLWGVKTDLKFGNLSISALISQQRGDAKVINLEGGIQNNEFEIEATDYEANRHFFLAQYFRDNYDKALSRLPIIQSAIVINKIEVWVTNRKGVYTESRNVLGFMDLGEHKLNIYNSVPGFQETSGLTGVEASVPFNGANKLYDAMTTTYSSVRDINQVNSALSPLTTYNFQGGQDYEKLESARKLQTNEYTLNEQLGYISLNTALNSDEVLAVAYEYTVNGITYKVGEFSTDGILSPQTLVVKLLKGTSLTPQLPTWDLMMKNIYSLNTYNLSQDNFRLDVVYRNTQTASDINYFPDGTQKGVILLKLLNSDRVNSQQDAQSDGLYDFIPGVTVNMSKGQIIFPVVEPFGSNLEKVFASDPASAAKYVFNALYDSTKYKAKEDASKATYKLTGRFEGATSNEVMLGVLNVTPGSVKVMAGGRELQENIDYTVDYSMGRVQIINSGIAESGTPIQVSVESQEIFSQTQKSLMGTHAEYEFSNKLKVGGTFMYLNERPVIPKVDYGQEPVNNIMLGANVSYNTKSNLITNIVDALPFYKANGESSFSFDAEMAKLIVNSSNTTDETGVVYLDDFEGAQTDYSLKAVNAWEFASIPQHQTSSGMFPEAGNSGLSSGKNRANVTWYRLDNMFLSSGNSLLPQYLQDDKDQLSQNSVRLVRLAELYPDKELPVGEPEIVSTFDVAFYPSEAGFYNFDDGSDGSFAGLSNDGNLNNPESRWGGIMRDIDVTDFEESNIEYIDFWLMDPFSEWYQDHPVSEIGGYLYFNLGNISEDILKDGRKSFESGLPTSDNSSTTDTTSWALVPNKTSYVNTFENSSTQDQQDIGFDGMTDEQERIFYASYLSAIKAKVPDAVYQQIYADPSGDNYHYYRGSDYDSDQASILGRYKKYRLPQGNSILPDQSPESYSTQETIDPDVEDINDDNTMNEYEQYYQYKINLRPDAMESGQNYIVESQTAEVTLENKQPAEVTWYHFRIPISDYDDKFGNIADFKSIRFLRMYMKNFKHPLVMRFGELGLIKSSWRIYDNTLVDKGLVANDANASLEMSVINIEQNSQRRGKVGYVIPPGIERVNDYTTSQGVAQNEQSMMLIANDIELGNAKAVYKSLDLDLRRYKRLKMEVHAESLTNESLNDDEMSVFIRLCTDFDDNYYEYEVPLTLTANKGETDPYKIWPDENRIDIPLDVFTELKLERKEKINSGESSYTEVFSARHTGVNYNKNIVSIKGTPSLADVKYAMIGVRNKQNSSDMSAKSVEVWVNELRLADSEDEGGWGMIARMGMQLSDLGSINASTRFRSAGFGAIDQTATERLLNDVTDVDFSTSLQLGKLLPESFGASIPMYFAYSQSVEKEEYNPLDADLTVDESLSVAVDDAERDFINSVSKDVVRRKSFNLSNINFNPKKREKVEDNTLADVTVNKDIQQAVDLLDKSSADKQQHKDDKKKAKAESGNKPFYHISNFSLSYGYNEYYARNINEASNIDKQYTGLFAYNYTIPKDLSVYPFRSVYKPKSYPFKYISDFNFNLLPTAISFQSDMYRRYNEIEYRDITNSDLIMENTYQKDWQWGNNINLQFKPTKSMDLTFTNRRVARIDEPYGKLDKHDDDFDAKRDTIIDNLLSGGRTIAYDHTIVFNYNIPINKFKLFDWVTSTFNYAGSYAWDAAPLLADDTEFITGNYVENSMVINSNNNLTLERLYTKIPYLKKVEQRFKGGKQGAKGQSQGANQNVENLDASETKEVVYRKKRVSLTAHEPFMINHNLASREAALYVVDQDGGAVQGDIELVNANTIRFTPSEDVDKAEIIAKATVKRKSFDPSLFVDVPLRLLMSVRRVSINYTREGGTSMNGFMPESGWFGGDNYTSQIYGVGGSSFAPGIPFLLGFQNNSFAETAASKGWLTTDSTILSSNPIQFSQRERITLRATIEPLPQIKIDLDGMYDKRDRESQYYTYSNSNFNNTVYSLTGDISMSVLTISSAFEKMGGKGTGVKTSKAFQTFLANRSVIAGRLAQQEVGRNPSYTGGVTGTDGYGVNSAQVLIPAFFAAYTGKNPKNVSLSMLPSMLSFFPNWRLRYDGLTKHIPALANTFKNISINHRYTSTYSISNYQVRSSYEAGSIDANSGNFESPYDISTVQFREQFAPLIGIDLGLINDIDLGFDYQTTRDLVLSIVNMQVSETRNNSMSFTLGYIFKNMDLFIKTKRNQKMYSNDLTIRAQYTFDRTKAVIRDIATAANTTVLSGQDGSSMRVTAEYSLSDAFGVRGYYERVMNTPHINAILNGTTRFGLSFTVNLF
ncbi:MAG: cell surface protein SprA [Bacteroidales bacterium]